MFLICPNVSGVYLVVKRNGSRAKAKKTTGESFLDSTKTKTVSHPNWSDQIGPTRHSLRSFIRFPEIEPMSQSNIPFRSFTRRAVIKGVAAASAYTVLPKLNYH